MILIAGFSFKTFAVVVCFLYIFQKFPVLGVCYLIAINFKCVEIDFVLRICIFPCLVSSHNKFTCRHHDASVFLFLHKGCLFHKFITAFEGILNGALLF